MTFPIHEAYKAAGIILASGMMVRFVPPLMHRVFMQSPILGINMSAVLLVVVYNLWKRYVPSIYITIFHGVRTMIESVPVVSQHVGHISRQASFTMRKTRNRRIVRTAVFGIMVQYCLTPASHFAWLHSVLACKFMRDLICETFDPPPDDTRDRRIYITLPIYGQMSISSNIVPFIKLTKLAYSLGVIYHQTFQVGFYFVSLTLFHEILLSQILEFPITQRVRHLEIESLEGLERYYVRVALGALEITMSVVFMVWLLVLQKQFLMLIALYTNIYRASKDIWRETFIPLITEWTVLASFERASLRELADYDDICPVCLSKMGVARKTQCGHFFHGRCLRQCLQENISCPMCKTRFSFH